MFKLTCEILRSDYDFEGRQAASGCQWGLLQVGNITLNLVYEDGKPSSYPLFSLQISHKEKGQLSLYLVVGSNID